MLSKILFFKRWSTDSLSGHFFLALSVFRCASACMINGSGKSFFLLPVSLFPGNDKTNLALIGRSIQL